MEKNMVTGSPGKNILFFALPVFAGNLFQQIYNVVDTVIVGKFVSTEALAAVGSTGTINFMILGFMTGLMAGITVLTSQRFGAEDMRGMRRSVASAGMIAIAATILLTVISLLGMHRLLVLMNTPDDIFDDAYRYIMIICAGILVQALYNLFACILRALGNSKVPLYFLLFSASVNIILDLVSIIILKMGVAGAAWATVLSQLISGLLCLGYMLWRFDMLRLDRDALKFRGDYVKRLCGMGIPMGLQYSITAIGCLILQAAVNSLGPVSIAAMTAGGKVGNLMCCPLDAMGGTMATYGGQNLGAGRLDRIHRGLKDCILLGVVYSVIAFVVLWFFGDNLSMLFLDAGETEILRKSQEFLVLNSAFYIPLALVNIIRFLIQSIGYSQMAVFAGVFEMVARSGVSLLLVPVIGYTAVCIASPAAWILADCFLIPAYILGMKKLRREMEAA